MASKTALKIEGFALNNEQANLRTAIQARLADQKDKFEIQFSGPRAERAKVLIDNLKPSMASWVVEAIYMAFSEVGCREPDISAHFFR